MNKVLYIDVPFEGETGGEAGKGLDAYGEGYADTGYAEEASAKDMTAREKSENRSGQAGKLK